MEPLSLDGAQAIGGCALARNTSTLKFWSADRTRGEAGHPPGLALERRPMVDCVAAQAP